MLFDDDINRDTARQSERDQIEGWLPLTPSEAREWSHVLTDFCPYPGVVLIPYVVSAAHGRRAMPPIGWWVETAKEFTAAGFSPLDWYLLRLTFEHSATDDEKPLMARPAAEWVPWLEERRGGLTPRMAMKRVLGRALPWED